MQVTDTQRAVGGVIVHSAWVTEGVMAVGDSVRATVDAQRRSDTMRNHTATHLLHQALRDVLGSHVRQAGSVVAPDRLRFDFTHVGVVLPEEIDQVQALVNESIRCNLAARKEETSYREAIAGGALAFFGDRYPERVRTLHLGDYSYEVCGGTHVERTGDIGAFRIVAESGIGTGIRRIEAVTGRGADAWVDERLRWLEGVARELHTTPAETLGRIAHIVRELAEARRAGGAARREASHQQAERLLGEVAAGERCSRYQRSGGSYPDGDAPRDGRPTPGQTEERRGRSRGSTRWPVRAGGHGHAGPGCQGLPGEGHRPQRRPGDGWSRGWPARRSSGGRPGPGSLARRPRRRGGGDPAGGGVALRLLGLDVGERRIGLAVGDTETGLAVPIGVLERHGDGRDPERLVGQATARGVGALVVGMPFTTRGELGFQAQLVAGLVDDLRQCTPMVVVTWDERYSSAEADRRLAERPVRARRGRANGSPVGVRDAVSATIILQSYLDAGSKGLGGPDG